MKKQLLNFLLSLLYLPLLAQNQSLQPYQELGITTEVLTLSNGKYQEAFSNDTLVCIGSVLFNHITGEVVSIVVEDTTYGEYEMRADVASRFLSRDPLARSYPMLTPYQFASNSPIANIDLDGLEKVSVIKYDKKARTEFFKIVNFALEGQFVMVEKKISDSGGMGLFLEPVEGKGSVHNMSEPGRIFYQEFSKFLTDGANGKVIPVKIIFNDNRVDIDDYILQSLDVFNVSKFNETSPYTSNPGMSQGGKVLHFLYEQRYRTNTGNETMDGWEKSHPGATVFENTMNADDREELTDKNDVMKMTRPDGKTYGAQYHLGGRPIGFRKVTQPTPIIKAGLEMEYYKTQRDTYFYLSRYFRESDPDSSNAFREKGLMYDAMYISEKLSRSKNP